MDLEKEIKFDKRMYGIKDVKTGKFIPPFLCDTDAEARRVFADIVSGGQESLVSHHPEDFDLFFLGGFDTVTGMHTGSHAEFILNAQSIIDDFRRKMDSLNSSSSVKQDTTELVV